jgi:SsrA-binding protein
MVNILQNKKVYFEYTIIEKYISGVQLMGTEVKSLISGKASISESFCVIKNNEVFIVGMHISEYKQIKYTNHEPTRERKLLLNRKEIQKLQKSIKEKGLTIVPISVFFSDTNFIKIEIGLVKGKKIHDKRNSIKEKDIKRELNKTPLL